MERELHKKMLKEIGSQLAIVVSQHEQLSLLKSSQQLSLLDQLIPDLETYMFDYSQLYQEYSAIKKEVSNFAQLKADIAQQEFFEFQLQDISQHAFQPNEDIELLNKKKNIVAKQDEQKLIHNLHYSCQEAYKYLQQVDSVALKLSIMSY